jgi:aquaporin Z
MRNLLTEFLGTFFLVLTVALCIYGQSQFTPLAAGVMLMVMVYAGGHISGGHYNPAVTLAVFMRGRIPVGSVAPYMIAQIAGATLAALASLAIAGTTVAPHANPEATVQAALLVEILFTCALAYVVLNVATSKALDGNQFYGLAIGLTVTAGAFAGGGVSGGALNPAVGIGLTLVDALIGGGSWADLWYYIVGPFAGGAIAALIFRIQHPGEA